MKVKLLEDVKHPQVQGKKGDVLEVADEHAEHLHRHGFAEPVEDQIDETEESEEETNEPEDDTKPAEDETEASDSEKQEKKAHKPVHHKKSHSHKA